MESQGKERLHGRAGAHGKWAWACDSIMGLISPNKKINKHKILIEKLTDEQVNEIKEKTTQITKFKIK